MVPRTFRPLVMGFENYCNGPIVAIADVGFRAPGVKLVSVGTPAGGGPTVRVAFCGRDRERSKSSFRRLRSAFDPGCVKTLHDQDPERTPE